MFGYRKYHCFDCMKDGWYKDVHNPSCKWCGGETRLIKLRKGEKYEHPDLPGYYSNTPTYPCRFPPPPPFRKEKS